MATTISQIIELVVFTIEDVRRLVGLGWRFRVKKSGDRRYINRRKGQREKSMGPYTEELWTMIQEEVARYEREAQKAESKTPSFDELYALSEMLTSGIHLREEAVKEREAELRRWKEDFDNLNSYVEKLEGLIEKLIKPGGYYHLEIPRLRNEIERAVDYYKNKDINEDTRKAREFSEIRSRKVKAMQEIIKKIKEMDEEYDLHTSSLKDFTGRARIQNR